MRSLTASIVALFSILFINIHHVQADSASSGGTIWLPELGDSTLDFDQIYCSLFVVGCRHRKDDGGLEEDLYSKFMPFMSGAFKSTFGPGPCPAAIPSTAVPSATDVQNEGQSVCDKFQPGSVFTTLPAPAGHAVNNYTQAWCNEYSFSIDFMETSIPFTYHQIGATTYTLGMCVEL